MSDFNTAFTFTITTTAIDGFDARLHFEISGFPDGVATFSANDVVAGVPVTLSRGPNIGG